MFRFNHILREEQKDDGGSGGGSGSGDETTFTQKQMDEALAGMQTQVDATNAKNTELLGKMSKGKKDAAAAVEETRKATEDAARSKGDFEQLFTSSQEKNTELQGQIDSMAASTAKDKQNSAAMRIANSLAEGDNVGLLSGFIANRLKYSDGSIKVLSDNGELTVSTIEHLQAEFQNNKRYASLLKGNQASGGNANGGKGGDATGKTMSREEFGNLNAAKKSEFSRSGGKLTD